MKFNCWLILICFSWYSTTGLSRVLDTPIHNEKCDLSTDTEVLHMMDDQNNQFDVYWANHAGIDCDGPGFPRIIVDHPKVRYWIHIVEVNVPYRDFKLDYYGWMSNLGNDSNRWRMLDISDGNRKNKIPFYNSDGNRLFHDNPKWGPVPLNSQINTRIWMGYLYGFEDKGMKRAIVQLKWVLGKLREAKKLRLFFQQRKPMVKFLDSFAGS